MKKKPRCTARSVPAVGSLSVTYGAHYAIELASFPKSNMGRACPTSALSEEIRRYLCNCRPIMGRIFWYRTTHSVRYTSALFPAL